MFFYVCQKCYPVNSRSTYCDGRQCGGAHHLDRSHGNDSSTWVLHLAWQQTKTKHSDAESSAIQNPPPVIHQPLSTHPSMLFRIATHSSVKTTNNLSCLQLKILWINVNYLRQFFYCWIVSKRERTEGEPCILIITPVPYWRIEKDLGLFGRVQCWGSDVPKLLISCIYQTFSKQFILLKSQLTNFCNKV